PPSSTLFPYTTLFRSTMNLIGKQKLPFTGSNPVTYQAREWSPNLTLMNAQITHSFSPVFEVYVGGENITNYRQQDAIIGGHDARSEEHTSELQSRENL